MSDFPPTADFFAPHVAASAYRAADRVLSTSDRPAADAPMNACGPVPPPAKASSQTDTGGDVEPLPYGLELGQILADGYGWVGRVVSWGFLDLTGGDHWDWQGIEENGGLGTCEVIDAETNALVDELIAQNIPPF